MGGIFERHKNMYLQRENHPIVPLEDIARDLVTLTDEQWGEYAFRRDPIYRKFSSEEKERLIRLSNECGDEYAEKCRVGGIKGYQSPYLIASSLGVEVEYPNRPSAKAFEGDRVLFAQYTTPNHIEVYTDCTDKAERAFSTPAMTAILGNVNMREILLCHELFHYFEYVDEKTIFTENEKKTLTLFKVIKNRSRIMCLGEIAAMRFAKSVMQLSYSPYVFDILLSYLYDKQTACNLYYKTKKLLFPEPDVTGQAAETTAEPSGQE